MDQDRDYGALGPAALARPLSVEKIPIRVSATRTTTMEVRRFQDTHLVDELHRLSVITDRQHHAALRLLGLFIAAGHVDRATPRYRLLREAVEEVEAEAEGEYQDEGAADVYRRILVEAGPIRDPVLDGLMHGSLAIWRLGVARNALDWLADYWQLEKIP